MTTTRRATLATALLLAATPPSTRADLTRTATFENFQEGQVFKPAFADPLSGITFKDLTQSDSGFVIEYSSEFFGGGNYLAAGGYSPGPIGGWAFNFGFTAELPTPARQVGVDVSVPVGTIGDLVLEGRNPLGTLVARQVGPNDPLHPLLIRIDTPTFQITQFKVISNLSLATGYDTITYTTLPEPTPLLSTLAPVLASRPRRR